MKKCTLLLIFLSFCFNLRVEAEDVYRYHPTSTHLTSLFDLNKRVQAADNYALHIWTNLLNHDPEIGLMTFFLVEKIYTHKIYNSDDFFAYLDKHNKKSSSYAEQTEAFLRLLTLYPENELGKELRTRMTLFYEVKKQMIIHSQEVAYLIKMHKKLTTAKEKMAFTNQSEKNEYLSYLKDPESFRNRLMMQVRKHEKLAKVFSEFPIYEGKRLIRNKPYEFFGKDKQEKNDVILSVLTSSYNDELIPNLKFFQVNITSLAMAFDSNLYRPVDDFNHFVEVFLKRYQSRTIAQELALSDSDKDYFGLILNEQLKEAKTNKVLLDLFAYKEDVLEEVVDVLKQSVDKGNFKSEHFLDIKTILTHRIYKAYPLSDSQQAHLWSFLIEYQPEAINDIRLVLNEAHSKDWDSDDFSKVLTKDNDDFDKGREQEVLLSTWALWHNQDARNIKSLYQAIAQNSRLLSK